jgi:tagatose-6-phosphate ketose/aldose isomerase
MSHQELPGSLYSEKGARHTAAEIANQPALWLLTQKKFYDNFTSICNFFKDALEKSEQIILTGAGTSAYIGLSLEGILFRQTGKVVRAIPTTHLLSHPMNYLKKESRPLIISFARSGNSPESCAVLELADLICEHCFHLIITCNADGALARYTSRNPAHVFVLPPDANDKSLAMTGSYSSMLLTGLLLAHIDERSFCESQVKLLVRVAEKILDRDAEKIRIIAEKNFQRGVFLGSGPFFGTATEAALKVQELTDGQVICKAESYLGFRHGPKAVIDETTLVVYFFSNAEHANRYETDLLAAMKTGNSAMYHLAIAERQIDSEYIDEQIILSTESPALSEEFLTVCGILPAQLLGFYKSLQLGLMPDDPSVNGAISRIVEGVTIYPVKSV